MDNVFDFIHAIWFEMVLRSFIQEFLLMWHLNLCFEAKLPLELATFKLVENVRSAFIISSAALYHEAHAIIY
jgi:hypothetical protein